MNDYQYDKPTLENVYKTKSERKNLNLLTKCDAIYFQFLDV